MTNITRTISRYSTPKDNKIQIKIKDSYNNHSNYIKYKLSRKIKICLTSKKLQLPKEI